MGILTPLQEPAPLPLLPGCPLLSYPLPRTPRDPPGAQTFSHPVEEPLGTNERHPGDKLLAPEPRSRETTAWRPAKPITSTPTPTLRCHLPTCPHGDVCKPFFQAGPPSFMSAGGPEKRTKNGRGRGVQAEARIRKTATLDANLLGVKHPFVVTFTFPFGTIERMHRPDGRQHLLCNGTSSRIDLQNSVVHAWVPVRRGLRQAQCVCAGETPHLLRHRRAFCDKLGHEGTHNHNDGHDRQHNERETPGLNESEDVAKDKDVGQGSQS